MRDTGKSRYVVVTEFNICFIIGSPSLFFDEYLQEAKRSAFFHAITYHAWFRSRIRQNIICSQTQLDDIAHEQTIICRQLFPGHVEGFQPMKRKKNLHRMVVNYVCFVGTVFRQVLCRWRTMRLALLVQGRAYLFALITADLIKVALLF